MGMPFICWLVECLERVGGGELVGLNLHPHEASTRNTRCVVMGGIITVAPSQPTAAWSCISHFPAPGVSQLPSCGTEPEARVEIDITYT